MKERDIQGKLHELPGLKLREIEFLLVEKETENVYQRMHATLRSEKTPRESGESDTSYKELLEAFMLDNVPDCRVRSVAQEQFRDHAATYILEDKETGEDSEFLIVGRIYVWDRHRDRSYSRNVLKDI